MQYFLPSVRNSLRSWSKSEKSSAASVIGVAVSRLHALIIVARLKRKGIAAIRISAVAAPGEIPDGIGPRSFSKEITGPALHSLLGETVEVVGALREQLEAQAGRTLEQNLHGLGLSDGQVSALFGAVDAGRVVLWVEAADRVELGIALDVFELNGADEVYALPASAEEANETRKSAASPMTELPGGTLTGMALA
jgi:hypothetical protein